MTEAAAKKAAKNFKPSPGQKSNAQKLAKKVAGKKNINPGKGSIIIKPQLCGKYCGTCPHGPYAWHVYNGEWTYIGSVGGGIGTGSVGKTSEKESKKTETRYKVKWDSIKGVGPSTAEKLNEEGYSTKEDLIDERGLLKEEVVDIVPQNVVSNLEKYTGATAIKRGQEMREKLRTLKEGQRVSFENDGIVDRMATIESIEGDVVKITDTGDERGFTDEDDRPSELRLREDYDGQPTFYTYGDDDSNTAESEGEILDFEILDE